MAALNFTVTTAAITLSSGVAKTVLQVKAPTNQRVRVKGFGVSFAGTSGTAVPVLVRVLRQTTAGTMTSLTPKPTAPTSDSIQSTASHTATVEPTNGDLLYSTHVHPQTGIPFYPLEDTIIGPAGYIGIECTAAAGVDVVASMKCEE